MLIRHGYDIQLTFETATAMVCLLSVHDERAGDIRKTAEMITTPAVAISTYHDLFGNSCQRLVAPPGLFRLYADGIVEDSGATDPVFPDAAEVPVVKLPDEVLVYLMGSRYCETDKLSQIAWDRFGTIRPGWGRVQAICDFVNSHIRFGYMDASATRGALEAYELRIGVCRDFAHLAIAFCRSMNIPARYVTGYLGDIGVPVVDPMDFSAWIEVFLGGRWHVFDPRNNQPRIGRIVVARGRDAADIPLINSFGPHVLKAFQVWAYEQPAQMPTSTRLPTSGMRLRHRANG